MLVLGAALACAGEEPPKNLGQLGTPHEWGERYPMLYDPRMMGDDDPELWARLPFTRLLLRREGCYGTCPVYEVELRTGGTARYTGGDHAPRRGVFEGDVGLYGYALLCAAAEDMRIERLEPSYLAGWTDDETVVLEWERDGEAHRIKDYGRRAPPAFQAYRALFDELVEQIEWTPVGEQR